MDGLLSEAEGTINDLSGYVHAVAKDKGWYSKERNDLELLCLIHSEISEACEGLRHGNPPDQHCPQFSSAEIELADAIVRILDCCAYKGWDIGGALKAKIAYNETRPHRHGNKVY